MREVESLATPTGLWIITIFKWGNFSRWHPAQQFLHMGRPMTVGEVCVSVCVCVCVWACVTNRCCVCAPSTAAQNEAKFYAKFESPFLCAWGRCMRRIFFGESTKDEPRPHGDLFVVWLITRTWHAWPRPRCVYLAGWALGTRLTFSFPHSVSGQERRFWLLPLRCWTSWANFVSDSKLLGETAINEVCLIHLNRW